MSKTKQIIFFADRNDFAPIVESFEAVNDVCYFQTGLFDARPVDKYKSLLENGNLGKAKSGDWSFNDSYLILPRNVDVVIREVQQRKGGSRFAVDQLANSKSIYLRPSGIFQDEIFVAGSVGTVSENDISIALYKEIAHLIKVQFRKIGVCYVGRGAETKLNSNWRLVTNDKLPREYDLRNE
ncbi:MAG: hypothetical protein JST68_29365 [Bacteroidetes bacterium]|nr:hypothetical protein [Bacteroidota bacterium]